ncbi:AFG1-family ATPase [Psychromonas ingrahamii 37]|uniref:Cell division protein ZapE n=1 Tax=Psychromonas ingrahamii (strain DSM 17664 / CCUG 51855 / 37) TaxID=357804 RepID=A1SYL7_PSYIN|nr:cell division protein ZapE [Psychromonas ingrahamii]ABM04582.1 AFG1-family ATPase [Psychromonas ingrahamii 37]
MTPLNLYRADLQKKNFFEDPAQAIAIQQLQRLYMDLQTPPIENKKSSVLSRLINKLSTPTSKKKQFKGIYFYGGVGRGKTYLVDLFFHSLPTKRKQRLHFHHFMLRVHKELSELQGQANPLVKIAQKFSFETDVLCFDEFYVDDITDAMILAGMLTALFEQGIVLVATSNIHPDDLYKNGLQRARFLPVIDLVKVHCEVFNLDGGRDYRIGRLINSEIYHYPLDSSASLQIKNAFENLADGDKVYGQNIEINSRLIPSIANSIDTLSIEFDSLCDGPRSVLDYIEIAILYRTVIIANIKQMDDLHNDIVRRFIAMVDEFYDHHVAVVISAEVKIMDLYIGEQLNFEFQRCVSRLSEMQSKTYLMQAHHVEQK